MVEAMGVTGVEGVYRKAAEISLQILRDNTVSLMSVLEAFVHDPLVEWEKAGKRVSNKPKENIRQASSAALDPIEKKLKGLSNGVVQTIPNQVELLIQMATIPANLAVMYSGWAPWL